MGARTRRGGVAVLFGLGAALALSAPESRGAPDQARPAPAQADEAQALRAFEDVARVLLSPRCRNCHPAGDQPLHGDAGTPHTMNISRRSPEAGLPCTACHREQNGPVPGAPPGVPGWHMPPRDTPMVFEGHSPRSLCLQLKDPAATGGRDVSELVAHVEHDAFVQWAWAPGPGRSTPPLSHADFVARVATWATAGGPCPPE